MSGRLLALVTTLMIAALLLWGPGSVAHDTSSAGMRSLAEAVTVQEAARADDPVAVDPLDLSGEHCFHKLTSPWLPSLTAPARHEVATRWIHMSQDLRQIHFAPAHPPPDSSA